MTSPSVVVTKPVEAKKPATVTSSEPIPFRKDSVTNTPEVFSLLVTTLLLVSIFAALAWYARRRGWLDRWVGPKLHPTIQNKKIIVLETLRLSQKTTLYRVCNGDNEFLLAESSMHIQFAMPDSKTELKND